jgi:hypothetical protein
VTDTPLDAAARAADAPDAAPDARARFYALLLETALCVPVRPRAGDDDPVRPQVFDLSQGAAALAFDDDARMAAFFEGPTEYVVLPGRAMTTLLAQARLGLGLNLGDAPSATLLDAATVAWLAAEMGGETVETAAPAAGALTVRPPTGASPALPAALAQRLAQFPGVVAEAWLARLGPPDAPGALTVALTLSPAARRADRALSAELGRAAAPHAPPGETVSIATLEDGHPLLPALRRHGAPLHAPPEAPRDDASPRAPARPAAPPRLR